jgi:hypothetical protein
MPSIGQRDFLRISKPTSSPYAFNLEEALGIAEVEIIYKIKMAAGVSC